MRYPGGKGRSYPQLLNLMPPHRTYIETHLGGGAVMRHKKPAQHQIGIDLDENVIRKWEAMDVVPCKLICMDATQFLATASLDKETLIYSDPPYVASTRRRKRVYRHDYHDDDHIRLLECLTRLHCNVMVSGYHNSIYAEALKDWREVRFDAMTHKGIRSESVWLNFEPAERLHDCDHLGANYREREVNRRRRARLHSRIQSLPIAEQHGLLSWLQNNLRSPT